MPWFVRLYVQIIHELFAIGLPLVQVRKYSLTIISVDIAYLETAWAKVGKDCIKSLFDSLLLKMFFVVSGIFYNRINWRDPY